MLYPSSINAIKSDNNQGINRISIYNLILGGNSYYSTRIK